MGDRFLRERGLADVVLHLNSIGDEVCRPAYRDGTRRLLRAVPRSSSTRDCRERLEKNPLRVFDCKVDGEKDFVLAAPDDRRPLVRARAPSTSRRSAPGSTRPGVAYELDPRLVRGLDYYTRTAFEWISGVLAENKAGTVNAGGRYDGLAEAARRPADARGRVRDGTGPRAAGHGGRGGRRAARSHPALFRGGDRGPVADGRSAPGGDPAGCRGAGGHGRSRNVR